MGRLHGLDALRGIAALYVVFHHATPFEDILPGGVLAVNLFIMMSGYVLSKSYDARLGDSVTPVEFIRRRVRRLSPVMAVGCVIGLFATIATGVPASYALVSLVLILLYLPSPPYGERLFLIDTPIWSLHYELLANILHGFALARLSDRALLWATGAMLAFATVLAVQMGYVVSGHMTGQYLPAFPHLIASYMIGVVLARFDVRFSLPVWLCLLSVPFATIAACQFGGWSRIAFIALYAPVVVASCAHGHFPRWGMWLGALSYPLYCVHVPIFKLLAPLGYGVSIPVAFAVAAGMAVAWEPSLRGQISFVARRVAEPSTRR